MKLEKYQLKLFKGLLFILFSIFLSTEAFATNYYVSLSGNDNYSGSVNNPFGTIQKAANVVKPGDTVIVKDGTYTDTNNDNFVVTLSNSGTSSNWITFRSENKWGARIADSSAIACLASVASGGVHYVRFEDFEVSSCYRAGFQLTQTDSFIYLYGNKVHDTGHVKTYEQTGRSCVIAGPETSNMTFDSNIIYNCGRLNPGTTPSAPESSCIAPADYVYNNKSYPYQNNCYTHDHGIRARGNSVTIINNILYGSAAGWSIVIDNDGTNAVVVNNTIIGDNPGRPGQLLAKATNLTIENNIFYGDAECGIATYTAVSTGGAIKNNLFYPNIDVRCDSARPLFQPSGIWTISNNIKNQDPNFINATQYDFHLQSTSTTVIDKGILAGVAYDADGNSRDYLPDIGAYEYAGQTPGTDNVSPAKPIGLQLVGLN